MIIIMQMFTLTLHIPNSLVPSIPSSMACVLLLIVISISSPILSPQLGGRGRLFPAVVGQFGRQGVGGRAPGIGPPGHARVGWEALS